MSNNATHSSAMLPLRRPVFRVLWLALIVSSMGSWMHDVGAGVYVVEWRGLGSDGHALNGTFSFTVE